MADILLKDKNGADVICENVKSVSFRTADGGSVSFGEKQEFNIAYGDEPPEDTSKLWIKCNTPEDVRVIHPSQIGKDDLSALYSDGEITTLDHTLLGSNAWMSAVANDRQIYTFGGYHWGNLINVYDLDIGSSTTLATTFSDYHYRMGCVSIGTKVYLMGGSSTSAKAEYQTINVFDIDTQTITTFSPNLFNKMDHLSPVTDGNQIYLLGGRYTSGSSTYGTDSIYVYDIEAKTRTSLGTKLPAPRYAAVAEIADSKVYLLGGYDKEGTNAQSTIYMLDTKTYAITTLSSILPTPIANATSKLIGDRIYIFGGAKGNNDYLDTINVFNIETNEVTTLNTKLPIGIAAMPSALIDTRVYLLGGSSSEKKYLSTINAFETATKFHLDENKALVVTSPADNLFDLLPNVTIGAELAYVGNANNEAEKVEACIYKDGEWTLI
jgi:N-acetylneuraminic acid mutarotase